jgi:uncharacterized protein
VISTADLPALPAIIEGTVTHRRRNPVDYGFQHHVYQWLIDLDHLPRLPWYLRPLARFDAGDHLGGTQSGASTDIKTNVERFLAGRHIDLGDTGRIVMLCNARTLGYVFDPLTVYWCFGLHGTLQCVVAEVHNTYGERHAYVLMPDTAGRAGTDKQFYVSPFNDVSGRYAMRFTLTDRHVGVTISLCRDGDNVFEAGFAGVPTPATTPTIARFSIRMPAMSQRVAALIRLHGIRLWLRRLPIIRRPEFVPQEGV